MATADDKRRFVQKYWGYAVRAAQQYGHNPVYILAQSVAERGWSGSSLSEKYNNFFGITAGSSWRGDTVRVSSGLVFRVYPNLQSSFDDYARLIKTTPMYAGIITDGTPEQFARTIAYSPYISEANGDNREAYRRNIIAAAYDIAAIPKPFVWTQRVTVIAAVTLTAAAATVYSLRNI